MIRILVLFAMIMLVGWIPAQVREIPTLPPPDFVQITWSGEAVPEYAPLTLIHAMPFRPTKVEILGERSGRIPRGALTYPVNSKGARDLETDSLDPIDFALRDPTGTRFGQIVAHKVDGTNALLSLDFEIIASGRCSVKLTGDAPLEYQGPDLAPKSHKYYAAKTKLVPLDPDRQGNKSGLLGLMNWLVPGEYELTVEAKSYQPIRKVVIIRAGETTNVTCVMKLQENLRTVRGTVRSNAGPPQAKIGEWNAGFRLRANPYQNSWSVRSSSLHCGAVLGNTQPIFWKKTAHGNTAHFSFYHVPNGPFRFHVEALMGYQSTLWWSEERKNGDLDLTALFLEKQGVPGWGFQFLNAPDLPSKGSWLFGENVQIRCFDEQWNEIGHLWSSGSKVLVPATDWPMPPRWVAWRESLEGPSKPVWGLRKTSRASLPAMRCSR